MKLLFIGLITFILFVNFPDLDIKIFGIGMHRFFLFHSSIFPLIVFKISKLIKRSDILDIIISSFSGSFSIAIGFHLFTDLFQKTAIYFPFIGSLIKGTSIDDRIWTFLNMIICILLSLLIYRRLYKIYFKEL